MLRILSDEKSNTTMLLTNKNIDDNALIIGDAPERITEKKYSGNVCVVPPVQKNEIIKSSNDKIKVSNAPATNAGESNGKIMRKNVVR